MQCPTIASCASYSQEDCSCSACMERFTRAQDGSSCTVRITSAFLMRLSGAGACEMQAAPLLSQAGQHISRPKDTGCLPPNALQCAVDGTNCEALAQDGCSCQQCKSGWNENNSTGSCDAVRCRAGATSVFMFGTSEIPVACTFAVAFGNRMVTILERNNLATPKLLHVCPHPVPQCPPIANCASYSQEDCSCITCKDRFTRDGDGWNCAVRLACRRLHLCGLAVSLLPRATRQFSY